MNQNPLSVLTSEHDIILKAAPVISAMDGLWSSDPEGYEKVVKTLVVFFQEFGDKYHHHKEEDILFHKLRDHPDFRVGDILQELEQHHEDFRDDLSNILDYLDHKEWTSAQKNIEQFFNALQDHIAIENDELFLMAESLFTKDELTMIYFLFEDKDRELGVARKNMLIQELYNLY